VTSKGVTEGCDLNRGHVGWQQGGFFGWGRIRLHSIWYTPPPIWLHSRWSQWTVVSSPADTP